MRKKYIKCFSLTLSCFGKVQWLSAVFDKITNDSANLIISKSDEMFWNDGNCRFSAMPLGIRLGTTIQFEIKCSNLPTFGDTVSSFHMDGRFWTRFRLDSWPGLSFTGMDAVRLIWICLLGLMLIGDGSVVGVSALVSVLFAVFRVTKNHKKHPQFNQI